MWEGEAGEREAVPMNRVQGLYSLLSKAEHLALGFICPGADGPVLHPCGRAGGRWALADAESQSLLSLGDFAGDEAEPHGGRERGRKEVPERVLKLSARTGSWRCFFQYKKPPELSAEPLTQSPHL